jgi:hypothetical protein
MKLEMHDGEVLSHAEVVNHRTVCFDLAANGSMPANGRAEQFVVKKKMARESDQVKDNFTITFLETSGQMTGEGA